MHPSAERLYLAAKSLKVEGQSAVARWLNESPQTLNNWERRGVSRRGAVEAQKRSGYSAAWILDGLGEALPRLQRAAGAAARAELRYESLSSEERRLIEHLRSIADEDEKRQLLEEAAHKAARGRGVRKNGARKVVQR